MRILLIRKRHLALGGVLAVFLSVFAGLLWQGNAAFTDAFSAQEQPRVTVVVDPGHGGEDGGAVAADGTVESLLESHHAVCLLTPGGAELLVHVGKDTVSLNGKHFAAHVKEGDKVKRGQLLLSFEREALLAEGFDLTTPVVVSNGDEFSMEKVQDGQIRPGDTVITLTKKA